MQFYLLDECCSHERSGSGITDLVTPFNTPTVQNFSSAKLYILYYYQAHRNSAFVQGLPFFLQNKNLLSLGVSLSVMTVVPAS